LIPSRYLARAARNGNFIVIRYAEETKAGKKKKNNNPPLQCKIVVGVDETPEMGRSGGEDFFFSSPSPSLSLSLSLFLFFFLSLLFFFFFFFFINRCIRRGLWAP
jgi:hypothetical protein